jgi:GT2 family glycosyltransferase
MTNIEVSIIIVSYNCSDLLKTCISSIYDYEKDLKFEIIVVDNNSSDDTAKMIQTTFPSVKFIQIKYNSGFARANNVGIKIAAGDKLLFLNPDIKIVYKDTINITTKFLESINSKNAIIGVQLMWEDGNLHGNLNLRPYGIKQCLMKNPIILKLCGTKLKISNQCSYFNGAFLLLWRNSLLKHKLFWDEDFFLYGEDVEWGYRASRAGFNFIKHPELRTVHLAGSCSSNQLARRSQILVSDWLAIRKTRGALYYLILIQLEIINTLIDSILYVFACLRKVNFTSEIKNENAFIKTKAKLICKFGCRFLITKWLSTQTTFKTKCYE